MISSCVVIYLGCIWRYLDNRIHHRLTNHGNLHRYTVDISLTQATPANSIAVPPGGEPKVRPPYTIQAELPCLLHVLMPNTRFRLLGLRVYDYAELQGLWLIEYTARQSVGVVAIHIHVFKVRPIQRSDQGLGNIALGRYQRSNQGPGNIPFSFHDLILFQPVPSISGL